MAQKPVEIPGPLGRAARARRRSQAQRALAPLRALLSALLPRLLDVVLSLAVLLLSSPLLLARGLWSLVQTGAVLEGETMIGRFRVPFRRLRFSGRGRLRELALWINVLLGDMAVVGPRPLSREEALAVSVADSVRFTTRPGLVSPFRLRRQVGIAHQGEPALDRDFVYGQSLRGDLGLAARSVVTGVLGGGARETPPLLNFFGIPILNTSMAEAVRWIIDTSAASATGEPGGPLLGPRQLAFVNPDCLNIAWRHAGYRQVLLAADRVIPDGIGIHIGCRMLGQSLRENVNGTDMFPLLCEAAAAAGRSLYLLGARPGIAAAAGEQMRRRFPALELAGARDGYFSEDEEPAVIEAVNASGADILLVAFGAPRQDLWLARHRAALSARVCMGVGGLFDFYSGRVRRAPAWMRELGLEWAYRLLQEPGRMWRRYVIGNPLFLLRVWRQLQHPERFPLPASGAASGAGAGQSGVMR